ncbi:lipopolysaccharide biosynthesis protein [Oenococcus oeni]|uniref:lipopolysaccharide biosynthesis protein n=2 Tax=Oenococcus oeni TaxID=1247 RepID=UPI0008F84D80|nr:lipopolysaccharide biosynthesis protein [Oenococcus oeni]OIK97477.1 lipopolysaccharide biosynthesis protein [Oenococcus oeni]PDH74276.1 polysaccharide biosynthesis export protein [Oenococcus oeni]PDH85862.1 polysaccharide biosynthesis export protein [Oenococcus oeni]PDH87905.1 polysaccharide biosynthesis export protein [Oenococcus oeni]PDH89982.1 polysaccharide biosynthesis export protein [Oenococcus oeni]
MQEIKKQLKTGVVFTAIGQYAGVVSNLLVSMVLSRILSPTDYGTLNIVLVFLPFFQMISELGVGPAIIQNHDLDDLDLSSLFKMLTVVSLLIGCFFGFFGFGLSWFYGKTIYIPIAWLLSINIIFSIMSVVPVAILTKNQQFKILNLSGLMNYIIGSVIGIISALSGLGVYALIIGSTVPAILNFFCYFRLSGLHVLSGYNKKSFLKVRHFSSNQFGFGLVNYFSRNLDNIMVGKFFGAAALGSYGKSYQMLTYPNSILTDVITPVIQPILAQHQEDIELIKNIYSKVLRLLFLVGVPLSFFLCINASPLIAFLFGGQWDSAIAPFKFLSLVVWTQIAGSTIGSIFQARNETKYLFRTGIISTVIIVLGIIAGIILGDIAKLAFVLSIAFLINFLFTFWMLTHFALKTNLWFVIKILIKPFLLSILPTAASLSWIIFGKNPSSNFFQLVINTLIFGIVFLIETWRTGDIKFVMNFIKRND